MYEQKIIENLRDFTAKYEYEDQKLSETCFRAADVIEKFSAKQTPMQVTEIHVDEYFCPSCGAENNCDQGYVQDAYCPVCGQRLWAEPPKEET